LLLEDAYPHEIANSVPFDLDLSGSVIQGTLIIEGVVLKDFGAKFLTVEGPMFLKDLSFNDKVNLEHSSLKILYLCGVSPLPKNSKVFGMTYRYISAKGYSSPETVGHDSGKCIEKMDQSELVKLPDQAQFKPSVYTDLEAFFMRQGRFDEADEVFVGMKTKERDLAGLTMHGAWNWLLHITVNHGRNPERAFGIGMVIIVIGYIVFRKDRMRLREPPDPEDPPKYNAFWYSFDLFLPLIDLNVSSVWVPKNTHPRVLHYMRAHMILGFILIPIGLAAFTGIIS
jgi:hypothetical protein